MVVDVWAQAASGEAKLERFGRWMAFKDGGLSLSLSLSLAEPRDGIHPSFMTAGSGAGFLPSSCTHDLAPSWSLTPFTASNKE